MSASELAGWDRLRHGGLLLDPVRSRRFANEVRPPVGFHNEGALRQSIAGLSGTKKDVSAFARFVLEDICGFTNGNGHWTRGSDVDPKWGRRGLGGETIKPSALWKGADDGLLPVFYDAETRIGVGRGKKAASQVVQWLRSGQERVAVLTNGKGWRLVFAGLDADAWCEWDADLWFEEGELSPQVSCLRILLSPKQWTPVSKDAPSPLVQAILDSRKGQAELSAALGERVREAVEILVQAHGDALTRDCADVKSADIYRAAVRIVMRMVVVLFAESRDLLPRDNALYHSSYGLGGLLGELEKVSVRGAHRLGRSHNAWPRVLALFRLVHSGSHHPALPVPAYGGDLFAAGQVGSVSGLERALHVFETACFENEMLSDRDVLRMLEKLTRTRVKIRQGKSSTWVSAPVDFSDLSSEYIGILYEGLLDFELKTAPDGDPVVFLGVGNQPALPLSRLEEMDDKALASLLAKMKDTSGGGDTEEDEDDEVAVAEEGDDAEEADEGEDGIDAPTSDDDVTDGVPQGIPQRIDVRQATRTRAEVWARRAAVAGKLVKRPRAPITPQKEAIYEEALASKARQLVTRVVLAGEWYLVRWGGTRKGSGTFYTRPGLAVPTVHRTLRPLAYTPPTGADGAANVDAPATEWTPKTPAEILSLTVCDPACGSGTFPVAALRFLSDALLAAHHHHGAGIPPDSDETRFKAKLKRQVVERCIYGVDLDPLAVELCRLALWIETMDRSLPFSFLDHKVKPGNSLTGAWFDTYQHYPVMAWKERKSLNREKAIKAFLADSVKPDLMDLLRGRTAMFEGPEDDPLTVHREAMEALAKIHELPETESAERARLYRELRGSAGFQTLKEAMDLWCACWFWPADALDLAPLPTTLGDASEQTALICDQVLARKQFFHWELEFPDVFGPQRAGFDAILGNPPWDIAKPSSKEFFSNIDPLYRSYGKQEALGYQERYCADAEVARDWELYNDDFKAQSNFVKQVVNPFGDPDAGVGEPFSIAGGKKGAELHDEWRRRRAGAKGYAQAAHPYRHQGSADVNLYKLFLEQAHVLLRSGGRLGFIVPSGLYSDHGTGDLRRLFLDHCAWEWLFGFENRDKIFDIHRSYKFNPIIVVKGGATLAIRTAFMRRKLEDWERAEEFATPYTRAQVDQFSPKSKAILEIQSARDLEILEKIYKNSVLLGDDGPDGWGIKYSTEFHMTNDSKLFPPRPVWEQQGYQPDEYGHWLKGDWRPVPTDAPWVTGGEAWHREPWRRARSVLHRAGPLREQADGTLTPSAGYVLSRDGRSHIALEDIADVALPLYEGRMIDHFDFSSKGWVSGKGRTAVWRDIPWDDKVIEPQYLMGSADTAHTLGIKVSFLDIGSATNARSMVSSTIYGSPCGNVAPVLRRAGSLDTTLGLSAALNCFAYDFAVRLRLGGLHLNYFVIEETPLARVFDSSELVAATARWGLALNFPASAGAALWTETETNDQSQGWSSKWALTEAERIRGITILEALIAHSLGLDLLDYAELLSDCDHPSATVRTDDFARTLDPKGFWRVDKEKDPELRHTVLAQVAFQDLQRMGLDAFLAQNYGEGWMLPETLRLSDYGLGHDNRAREPQPVASRLGPRFHPWQLEGSVDESWEECRRHAALIRAIRSHGAPASVVSEPSATYGAISTATDLLGQPIETDLFGQELATKKRRKKSV